MATLVYMDVPFKNSNPTAVVLISTDSTPLYIMWDDLSTYDQSLVTSLESQYQYPLTLTNLIESTLPNGMSFYQTYKMLIKRSDTWQLSFVGTENPAVVPVSKYSERLQLSIQPANAVTGTLAVTAVPFGKTTAEVILDDVGDPLVIDLAAPQTVLIEGVYTTIYLTPTAVTGAYDVIILGLQ